MLKKNNPSINNFSQVIAAGSVRLHVLSWCVIQPDMPGLLAVSFHCVAGYVVIPVVWILSLNCFTVMPSHWQIDMTHSPAGILLCD